MSSERVFKPITRLNEVGLLLKSSKDWHDLTKTVITQLESYIYMVPMIPLYGGGVLVYITRQHIYLAGCSMFRQNPLDTTQPRELCAYFNLSGKQCIEFSVGSLVVDYVDPTSGLWTSATTGTIEDPAPGIVEAVRDTPPPAPPLK